MTRNLATALVLLLALQLPGDASRSPRPSPTPTYPDPVATTPHQPDDPYGAFRNKMVQEQIAARHIFDTRVSKAMRTIPRHLFVPEALGDQAYDDNPLPIGYGQTISQPYIVALMTELVKPQPTHRVLEIGTGSGYQAAVMSVLVKEVYTVEIVPPLASQAEQRLKQLGYRNVRVKYGDGYYGWKAHAPYDAILVTAAANHIPPSLLQQLKEGGRLCIPVGSTFFAQDLLLIEKKKGGETITNNILPVRFVPLRGGP